MEYCILCGDDTEKQNHKVCAWHAVCEKDNNGNPLYNDECTYALNKFRSYEEYINHINEKKHNIHKILNYYKVK